ncbi:MAG: SIMPL domain-containing protein [Candidatus Accumulibacter sp.]|jgi:predicted secreted protein|nr:SIMPL domain-containing protein [Accumulibacter sp.]
MKAFVFCVAVLSSILAFPCADAAPAKSTPRPARIDISVTAEVSAVNDQFRATVVTADSGKTPGEIAQKINADIATAIAVARAYPAVKVQSGNTSTSPNYGSKDRIESWTMRSELLLESPDVAQLSELLGKLPPSIGISSLGQYPGPKNQENAENAAILEGIAAFKKRAKLVADTFGKPYRITKMQINTRDHFSPRPLSAAIKSSAPIEAGETRVSVTVSGQIEIGTR